MPIILSTAAFNFQIGGQEDKEIISQCFATQIQKKCRIVKVKLEMMLNIVTGEDTSLCDNL